MFEKPIRKNHSKFWIVMVLLTLSVEYVKPNDYFDLIILHTNDMHGRFLPIDSSLESYRGSDMNSNKGFGGFARISRVLKDYRQAAKNGTGPPVLYLDAGDIFTGSRWFSLFKSNITADFMNILYPDAMCLGNHEFDHGIETLQQFLNRVKFPVLFSNFENGANHSLRRTKWLMPSCTIRVKGVRIGIIGYLTPETREKAPDCDVKFTSEIMTINDEARELHRNGANIIIALGHSGFKMDLEIAANCPRVDIVIGGHSHKFLYTGRQPDTDSADGATYPTIVTQANGKEVPVVTAFWATKYLGKLELRFKNGRLYKWGGNPILLHPQIPQDRQVMALEKEYRKREREVSGPPIGQSKLDFNDLKCRILECGLGNIMTDSFVKESLSALDDISFISTIALFTSGSIRSGLRAGNITRTDLEEVLPFNNDLVIVKCPGDILLQALEYSVRKYREQRFIGTFLQISGMRVVFDMARSPGNRVKTVEIRTTRTAYEKLDFRRQYNVIITSFMHRQSVGFAMFGICKAKYLPVMTLDAFQKYVKAEKIIKPASRQERRITILNEPPLLPSSPPFHSYN
ncbi:protein 5NUC-like [Contarinia nasturtii]|uniref:protein 5NUC-like n=1 Tax=Contarinia nasturtii TaxID=265458 RepID=UPI0012D3B534|nr:protein 5NUC-like [Contarinia nasturtii]